MGNGTYIDLLLVSSALSRPNFILIEKDNFYTNFVSKSWRFGVFADISARSSRKKKLIIFHIRFYSACAVLCQGQCFQFSSPNSQKRWRLSLRKHCPFFCWPSLGNIVRFWLAQLVLINSIRRWSLSYRTE